MSAFFQETPKTIKRVMIVGASGYLGSALALGLRDDFEVFGTYYESPMRIDGAHFFQMNCLDGNDILSNVQRFNPDFVIYCSGISDVNRCAVNPMLAAALNTKAVMLFFKVFSHAVPLMYFSSDHVFSSSVPNDMGFRFHEKSKTDPKNEYGSTRIRGESQILEHNRLNYVMRLPRIYGERLGSPLRPRETWIQETIRKIQSKERVSAVVDQWRSSLYIGDLVRAVRSFITQAPVKSTLYHMSPSDSLTPYESAMVLAEKFGLDSNLVDKIELKSALENKPYEESSFCSLDGHFFEEKFNFKFQNFSEGLEEMKERLNTGYIQNWA